MEPNHLIGLMKSHYFSFNWLALRLYLFFRRLNFDDSGIHQELTCSLRSIDACSYSIERLNLGVNGFLSHVMRFVLDTIRLVYKYKLI